MKALGVYRGRKKLGPEFNEGIFVRDDTAERPEADKCCIAELKAKLANAASEMAKAKA